MRCVLKFKIQQLGIGFFFPVMHSSNQRRAFLCNRTEFISGLKKVNEAFYLRDLEIEVDMIDFYVVSRNPPTVKEQVK